ARHTEPPGRSGLASARLERHRLLDHRPDLLPVRVRDRAGRQACHGPRTRRPRRRRQRVALRAQALRRFQEPGHHGAHFGQRRAAVSRSPMKVSSADARPADAGPTLWAEIREALRGSSRDLTRMPVGRAVLLLAIPMVAEMSMESLFTVVDIFWVSHLGSNAVAAVGLTESMLAIVYALAMGLSMGATALVSRRIGENDEAGASRAALHIIAAGIVCALAVGA